MVLPEARYVVSSQEISPRPGRDQFDLMILIVKTIKIIVSLKPEREA